MSLLVMACTKEVGLFTEVEFELIEQHEEEGYINQGLSTTLGIIAEEELEGNSYSYTYSVSGGGGHFENRDGERLPGDEPIPFNPLASSVVYKGIEKGEHTVKVVAEDSFGFTEEIEISYNIIDVPLVWTATATATQVEVDKNVAITLTLEDVDEDNEVSFESRYTLSSGSGVLTGLPEADNEVLQEFTSIIPGAYTLNFVPDALGSATLVFDLKDSNGQELQTSVTFEVVQEVEDTVAPEIILLGDNPQEILLDIEYVESGATASDDIDGDLSDQIEIDATAVDTAEEGSYEVIYSVSDADGNVATAVRTVLVVSGSEENQAPTAVDDNRATVVDAAISLDPRTNDSDPENDALTITQVGEVTPSGAGTVDFDGMSITFTPAAGSTETARFEYTINDGNLGNDANATITVTVEG
ncbi:MAG: immunoglobulin-like domain-containing protein, partial [Pricia sp.]